MRTRAAVLREAPGPWRVEELELGECGPHDVRVRIEAAGLCRSDDHFATAVTRAAYLPLVGGHEGAGVVTETGSAVTGVDVGDHVVTTFIPGCGRCRWCASGQGNLCDQGARIMSRSAAAETFHLRDGAGTGVAQMALVGTFAQHTVVPEVSVIRVDRDIPFPAACLVACGVPTGWGAATEAGRVGPGDVVIVMGVGGIGVNSVQGARVGGASHVLAVDPSEFKRDQALRLGATEAFGDIAEATDRARKLTNGQGADAALVSVGVLRPEHLTQAFAAVRKAGTIVVTSLGPADEIGIPVSLAELTLYQKRIQGSLFGTLAPAVAVPRLLAMYRSGGLRLDELVTRTYPLEEINTAYADMRAGSILRGVIRMQH